MAMTWWGNVSLFRGNKFVFQLIKFIPKEDFLFFWFAALILSDLDLCVCCGDQFTVFFYTLVLLVSYRHSLISSVVEHGGLDFEILVELFNVYASKVASCVSQPFIHGYPEPFSYPFIHPVSLEASVLLIESVSHFGHDQTDFNHVWKRQKSRTCLNLWQGGVAAYQTQMTL